MRTPSIALLTASFAAVMASTSGVTAYTLRDASGEPVRWAVPSAIIVADPSIADLGPGAEEAVLAAIDVWSAVAGSYVPVFSLEDGTADEVGYHHDRENRSTIRFAKDGFEPAGHALAVTVVSYDEKGRILDADIVINGGPSRRFAVAPPGDAAEVGHQGNGQGQDGEDGGGRYDLRSVLTHELGHVLGLDEEPAVPEATMFPTTARGETTKRDLSSDDEEGLRVLYSEPFEESGGVGCSIAGAGPATPWTPLLVLVAAGFWIGQARRRPFGTRQSYANLG